MSTATLYPTTARLIRFALPAMLAGVTVPLMGMVDVAILGRLGDPGVIAAAGVAASVFTVVAWSFSFLRFTTTGLVAQGAGRDDEGEMVVQGLRPLVAGLVGGLALVALQAPIIGLGLTLIAPEPEVAALARDYFGVRILGAPLTLALYALNAWLMGAGSPRTMMLVQLLQTVVNALLTLLFVLGLDWGITGAAWGTVLAEVSATVVVTGVLLVRIAPARWRAQFGRVFEWPAWKRLLSANTDLVIRTVLLSLSLALLNERSAKLGTLTLAANQILLQAYLLVATLIDGVSLGAEVFVGRAVGARHADALRHVVRRSATMAAFWGLAVAALVALAGRFYPALMTTNAALIAEVERYWAWQVVLPVAGVWAFMFDGVFFGATYTRALRNSMIVSAALYAAAVFPLATLFGNHGLWLAIGLQLVVRALTLWYAWPQLVREVAGEA